MELLANFIEQKIIERKMLVLSLSDGDWSGSLVNSDKDDLSIDQTFENPENITHFLDQNNDVPIIISINNPNVLWFNYQENLTADWAIEKFEQEVPNADPKDFLINYQGSLLAVARYAFLEERLGFLEKYNSRIVYVGLSPVNEFLLAQSQDGLAVCNFSFAPVEQGWQIETLDEPSGAEFEGVSYAPEEVVHLATAMNYISGGGGEFGKQVFRENKTEFLSMRVFDLLKYPVLGFLLLIFLINGILFYQWNSVNAELVEKSSTLKLLDNKLESINTYIDENKEILNQVEDDNFSILCDQLGASVPSDIKLSLVEIRPLSNRRFSDSKFRDDEVVIEGYSKDSRAFSAWVSSLEREAWVVEIASQKFEKSTKQDWKGKFQLIVKRDVEKT